VNVLGRKGWCGGGCGRTVSRQVQSHATRGCYGGDEEKVHTEVNHRDRHMKLEQAPRGLV